MDERFMDVVLSKLEELRVAQKETQADVHHLKVTAAEHHIVLKDHTRRSDANERAVAELKRFTAKWAGVWTGLGVIATLAGIGASVAKILGAF